VPGLNIGRVKEEKLPEEDGGADEARTLCQYP